MENKSKEKKEKKKEKKKFFGTVRPKTTTMHTAIQEMFTSSAPSSPPTLWPSPGTKIASSSTVEDPNSLSPRKGTFDIFSTTIKIPQHKKTESVRMSAKLSVPLMKKSVHVKKISQILIFS